MRKQLTDRQRDSSESDEMELKWTKEQKLAMKSKVEDSIKKKFNRLDYKDMLLRKCKEHGGPFTSNNELKLYVKYTDDKHVLRTSLRHEVGFSKLLHPSDAKE